MKQKIITIIFLIYLFSFPVLHILIKDEEISNTERRKLTTYPKYSLNSEYITKVEKYLLDHTPFREKLRTIKANYNYQILNKLDNNQIFLKDNYIYKSNYPTNFESIDNFIKHIEKTTKLLSPDNQTYIMIIPDKNYYLKDEYFLKIDYEYLYKQINNLNITPIDIRNILTLDDYYQTDAHWRQENLDKVIKHMSNTMNFEYQENTYQKNTYNDFYGVYYGESAISRNPETIIYLTNDIINNSHVTYLENKNLNKVYNLDKLTSLDSYEIYLDGASSYIEINNQSSKTNKELVIFRDSFGSSITPLLINYYSKITLIDNRYITSSNYQNLIEFTNQDVLFIYSTLLVNDSLSLKN